MQTMEDKDLLRIRAITAFITLSQKDFDCSNSSSAAVSHKIEACATVLQALRQELGRLFTVQTLRVATNPFTEWLIPLDIDHKVHNATTDKDAAVKLRLEMLQQALQKHDIVFCSLGPATAPQHLPFIHTILAYSPRFSCSIDVQSPHDSHLCSLAAETIIHIAHHIGVEANFRFCVQASCHSSHVPFFPAATTRFTARDENEDDDSAFPIGVAIGLENGPWFQHLIRQQPAGYNIMDTLLLKLTQTLAPIQLICQQYTPQPKLNYRFLGIDTSLNPCLDAGIQGSALMTLELLRQHFCPTTVTSNDMIHCGTVAVAALLTKTLQSLSHHGIQTTGYSGIMLPVCEDVGLATQETLQIQQLLMISSVCGVGIDTVPIPGSVSPASLTALIMDVVGLAHRWNKPLTCRLFPCPGREQGDWTQFDSPFLCNSRIMHLP